MDEARSGSLGLYWRGPCARSVGRVPPAGEKTRSGPEEPEGSDDPDHDEPLSPTAERALSGLPFFFGGALAIFLAYELRSATSRSGIPPLWVLFLTLGIVALVAGFLLVLTTEPSPEEEEEDPDHVVLPRKEWDHLQLELRRLRSAQGQKGHGAKDLRPQGGSSPPGGSPAEEVAAPTEWSEDKDENSPTDKA
jgi:hypothetical protein